MTSINPHLRRNHRRLTLQVEIALIAAAEVAGHLEIPAGPVDLAPHQADLVVQAMGDRPATIQAGLAETAADRIQLMAATQAIQAVRALQAARLEIIELEPATIPAPAQATMPIMPEAATAPMAGATAITMPTTAAEMARMAAITVAMAAPVGVAIPLAITVAQETEGAHPQAIMKLFGMSHKWAIIALPEMIEAA